MSFWQMLFWLILFLWVSFCFMPFCRVFCHSLPCHSAECHSRKCHSTKFSGCLERRFSKFDIKLEKQTKEKLFFRKKGKKIWTLFLRNKRTMYSSSGTVYRAPAKGSNTALLFRLNGWDKPWVFRTVEQMLLTNIRLGWKCLTVLNTQAYRAVL